MGSAIAFTKNCLKTWLAIAKYVLIKFESFIMETLGVTNKRNHSHYENNFTTNGDRQSNPKLNNFRAAVGLRD